MSGALPVGALEEIPEANGLLVLRIRNEARANALDDAVLDQLPIALLGERAQEARVIILTGFGDRVFSAGVAIDPGDPATQIAALRRREALLTKAVAAIDNCTRPVICAVNGAALGGAVELAAACDWRIASEQASFAMPPARLGLVYLPDGLRRFVALVGPGRVSEMLLTARSIGAQEAAQIGLVNEVRLATELVPRAVEMAGMVAGLAPIAVAGIRATIRAIARNDSHQHVADVAQRWRTRAYASQDLVEGLAAFSERRPPVFTDA